MNLTLKYFASVREAVGTGSEQLTVPLSVATVGALRAHLLARGEPWAQALAPTRALRMACNQVMCTPDTPIAEGCEVAFFPPVTGG